MNIVISGGTGFIGKMLTNYLVSKNHSVYILTRNIASFQNKPNITYVEWLSPNSSAELKLENIDVFINLAGESINSGRWTDKRKQIILNSRLYATDEVIQLISKLTPKPRVLINASAIGFYGTSLTKTFTENDIESGHDFLATTTRRWEDQAKRVEELGIRLVLARLGVVLAKNEGALPRMVLPYKFFIGGKVGIGQQWLSWIHIDDVVRMFEFVAINERIKGPINLTAPIPEKMDAFGRTIGKVIKRPHLIPAPEFALKLLLGEMSSLVLEGQKVIPEKALTNHFSFKYEHLEDALRDILTQSNKSRHTNDL
ncbi:TIGR01777 family oxidoreductase [Bacillus sp. Marseille-P3661]|uniref:TIGR01777 family oxidoreductase n=1 Tax=Bacillus sp. Marseille-P3661 TaxID=1936234 RepID=UPI000C84CD72|nr:TIGR01777 family oxidoreductase [Bacillus sp. Marseille-P3661]